MIFIWYKLEPPSKALISQMIDFFKMFGIVLIIYSVSLTGLFLDVLCAEFNELNNDGMY